jgi:proline iminopeptidase
MHIHVNGTRLWFDADGASLVVDGPGMRERPTILLLHGGPGSFDHSYLKPDFSRLTSVGQVLYLDMRGHGRSEHGDPARWSFAACADDLPPLCEALGITNPIVYGHSLGGFVAIEYAIRHPGHAGGLVLDSTCAHFDTRRLVEGMRRVGGDEVADIAERVYVRQEDVTAEEWTRCWKLFGKWVPGATEKARTVFNLPLNSLGLALMGRFDRRDQLGRIDRPALVVAGELDPATSPAMAGEIVAGMRPGLARLEIIEGAGHFAWKDAPERYWPVLERFIRDVSTPSRGIHAASAAS